MLVSVYVTTIETLSNTAYVLYWDFCSLQEAYGLSQTVAESSKVIIVVVTVFTSVTGHYFIHQPSLSPVC